jgi:saxitoxin biosynthesis operon SxtJ-like protein
VGPMNWSDVTRPPSSKTLRQFAGLCLVVFGSLVAWRRWHGQAGSGTIALAIGGGVVGVVGLLQPSRVRWIYTAAMAVAFPIGWLVSRAMLAILFYLVITPIAVAFRMAGRDVLRVRRRRTDTYWTPKPRATGAETYFRQS